MRPPGIGMLRHELVLDQQVRTPSAGGGAVLTWETIGPLWADVRPSAGRETVVADELISRISHDVWIRHRAGTTAGMRFRMGAQILDILAVLPAGGRQQWLRCLCRERAP